jgi:hypothetical protein
MSPCSCNKFCKSIDAAHMLDHQSLHVWPCTNQRRLSPLGPSDCRPPSPHPLGPSPSWWPVCLLCFFAPNTSVLNSLRPPPLSLPILSCCCEAACPCAALLMLLSLQMA